MCGICGLVERTGELVELELIERMCSVMTHRGPDDQGTYARGEVGLGMRRLSIIDLAGGHQPIANEDETVWVVMNGEIYNYRELRRELESKGHRFTTCSDTEVLVHLYEEWGEECVRRLRGMFGFSLWDEASGQLLLARDRMGIKPVHFAASQGRLAFASELKSLLLVPWVDRSVDLEALDAYLSFSYLPAPLTIYSGIRKLPPGHLLTFRPGEQPLLRRYWDIPACESARHSEAYYCERLQAALGNAVRCHLMSDVPLGVLLSGGLDSSAVVAMMSQVTNQPIKTFSIGFEERSFNELAAARQIARRFGTDHHEYLVRPDALELIEKLLTHFDEPFADSSALPTYLVCRLARQEVTVALSGDGGDELFAGYMTYSADRLADHYQRMPGWLRNGVIAPLVRRLPVSSGKVSFDYRAKRFIAAAHLPPLERHHGWKEIFSPSAKRLLYARALVAEMNITNGADWLRPHYEAREGDELARLQYVDGKTYLPDDILLKVDRMSMAHSLEVRPPLLDHEVVETAATTPSSLKLKGLTKKYLLKRAMAGLLPRETLRARKQGFSIPLAAWFRGPLRSLLQDSLSPAVLHRQGFFDTQYVGRLLEQHLRSEADHSRPLWTLLMFTLWHQAYVEAARYAPESHWYEGNRTWQLYELGTSAPAPR